MLRRKSLGIFLLVSLLTGNVAQASFRDGVVGGIVGGVVGSVITNEVYKKKKYKKKRRVRQRAKKKHVKRYVAPKPKMLTAEMKIQKSLTSLGFYRGKIDGEVNSYETRAAIKAMNIAYEIGDTASLAPRSRDSLIYLGDLFTFDRILIAQNNGKKAKAKKIQAALKIHGFYHDKIDGAIGSGTRRNIAEYKMAKGLSSGTSFDFEEEYQLVSSAKQANDKNMDDAIASLKVVPMRNQPTFVNTQAPRPGGVVMQRQNTQMQQYIPAQQQAIPVSQSVPVQSSMPARQNNIQNESVPVAQVTNNVMGNVK